MHAPESPALALCSPPRAPVLSDLSRLALGVQLPRRRGPRASRTWDGAGRREVYPRSREEPVEDFPGGGTRCARDFARVGILRGNELGIREREVV